MWPWPWPLTYFWKTDIGDNSFVLRDRAFHIWHACSLWQGKLDVKLLLKNFNIGHNSFVLRGRAFIFGIRVPYDKAYPIVQQCTINFEHVALTMTFDLLLKNFDIGDNSFVLRGRAFILGLRASYGKANWITRPIQLYYKFWTCDLDRDLWTTFEKVGTLGVSFYRHPCSVWQGTQGGGA